MFKCEELADKYSKSLHRVVPKCACPVCGCKTFIN